MKALLVLAAILTISSCRRDGDRDYDKLMNAKEDCEQIPQVMESNVPGTLALCVYQKIGRIDLNGNIDHGKLKDALDWLIRDSRVRYEAYDECKYRDGFTREEAALNLYRCIQKYKDIDSRHRHR